MGESDGAALNAASGRPVPVEDLLDAEDYAVMSMDDGAPLVASRSYFVVPYKEPDGRVTFAVQEKVERPGYLRRHLVSFHEKFADAMAERERRYARA